MTDLMTRQQYVTTPAALLPDGKLDSAANMLRHRAYYAQLVDDRTIARVLSVVGAEKLLASTDEHFNDIPMRLWDAAGSHLPMARKFGDLGDYPTLAGLVCVVKEAARQWVERQAAADG